VFILLPFKLLYKEENMVFIKKKKRNEGKMMRGLNQGSYLNIGTSDNVRLVTGFPFGLALVLPLSLECKACQHYCL
jgi:hypothetical protein